MLVSESEDDDMTDAFLLRSARVGGKVGSGECLARWTVSSIGPVGCRTGRGGGARLGGVADWRSPRNFCAEK